VSARCQKRRLTCSCHTPHTVWSENQYACLDRNGSLSPEKATGGNAPRPLSEWGGQPRWIETKVVHDTGTVSGYGLPTSSVPVPAA
jgi:hypothetical protein